MSGIASELPLRPTPAPIDYAQLLQRDWTFADAHTRGETHGIHPYPAKFIPQIPQTLIAALYRHPGTGILDPFCGSGTTLVEAARSGISSIGIDLHPLACLLSKVKVTPLNKHLLDAGEAALVRSETLQSRVPPIPALDHWFEPAVQHALAALIESIDAEMDMDVRDALRVALSNIVVRVSNQESDTRYAAIKKDVSSADVRALFRRSVTSLDRALRHTWRGLFPPAEVEILNRDVLLVRRDEIKRPISLVITSPPYPNAYEYWLYHKYRMYWLGMDPIAVRRSEIGARPHYFKRNPHTAEDFARQMSSVFSLLASVMIAGGHACFQVGSSVIRGELVDNASALKRSAEAHGFALVVAATRNIPMHRKAFNLSHARIKDEAVLVFRLETP